MNISEHLTLKEVTKSNEATRAGIDNTPTPEHLTNLITIAEKVFEPLRIHFAKSIGVSSGYRSKVLNAAVKGSATSQHCFGQALDLDADIFNNGITNSQIFHWIKDNLVFDQLIWEFGDDKQPAWVHVSYVGNKVNRKKLTRALPGGEYVDYK